MQKGLNMNYLSVCSGIEAATVAWDGMDWNPLAFSEIEKFPSEVLKHHYPTVPNFGDMTKFKEWDFGTNRLDLLVGGTPCQSFSVAGLRKGLEDPRGNLALVYCGILDKFRPKWFVWENVQGVLSSNQGRDFGSFLGALAELGYGFSYRVLDAQYFGVAQRRKRVFVVGHLGNWQPAAKVLFEPESLSGNFKASRKTRETIAEQPVQCFEPRSPDGHARIVGNISPTLNTMTGGQRQPCVAIQGNLIGRDKGGPQGVGVAENSPMYTLTKGDVHAVAHAFKVRGGCEGGGKGYLGSDEKAFTLSTTQDQQIAVGVDTYNGTIQGDVAATMTADMAGPTHSGPKVMQNMAVRRLTPVECERLQGFPDNYTNIKENCPDGPRYKALGNSMAVPVMRWIGNRIQMVEDGLI
jgi:DNA (cytosine-5)-methyltransferase 1